MKKLFIVSLMCLFLCGCGKTSNSYRDNTNESYTIDCKKKDELVKNGALLIDVRTEEEYDDYHLDGSINIPVDEIVDGVIELDLKKDDVIIVYCKSGNRSIGAYRELKNNGYLNVYDLGSISKCDK